MTVTYTTAAAASETSGIFAEAIGGIATIVLAIIALAGTAPEFLLAVATDCEISQRKSGSRIFAPNRSIKIEFWILTSPPAFLAPEPHNRGRVFTKL